jgi:hypothetical protein
MAAESGALVCRTAAAFVKLPFTALNAYCSIDAI